MNEEMYDVEKARADKRLVRWADEAMWTAEAHENPQKPQATVTWGTADPLGVMAMINGQYVGKVYRHPGEVTDDERREAWEAGALSRLSEAPMEWFQVSVLFENVTRAFTHQLVRTRLATFAQESMRFAVKEDLRDAVKLPPSIAGTRDPHEVADRDKTKADIHREVWDEAITHTSNAYQALVDDGMPAEDARGLLPTNTLTRIHMRCDIKTLISLAGLRLCTQAQYEWRQAFAQLAKSFREYSNGDIWCGGINTGDDNWQYALVADRFRPVCFQAGKCTMKSKADRYCAIRDRVDALEESGIPPAKWEQENIGRNGLRIDPIMPYEWLADPNAARRPQGGRND